MIVVADTSPLNYLILIEAVDVLPGLYDRIAIPPAVLRELQAESTPDEVRKWVESSPPWLEVARDEHARLEGIGRRRETGDRSRAGD